MIDQYSIGASTLSNSIYDIQPNILHNPGQYLVQKTPLKRSRLLMNLPENSVVIDGDDMQRTQSIKNMITSLENAGATPDFTTYTFFRITNSSPQNITSFLGFSG